MNWPRPWFRVLWAPWRMAYIKRASTGVQGECVFCDAPKLSDEEALILYRGEKAYVILNRYPYNSGHLMIVPYRHKPSIEEFDDSELLEMGRLVKASVKALRSEYGPHGFNIGANIGEAAGAGIAGHFHVHVVPRWRGDSNFMITTGGAKVIPESLDETLKRLKPAIRSAVRELDQQPSQS